MIKKFLKIAGIVLLVGIFFLFGARLLSGEDDWICVDGQWIKHGAPSAPMPESGCGDETKDYNAWLDAKKELDKIQALIGVDVDEYLEYHALAISLRDYYKYDDAIKAVQMMPGIYEKMLISWNAIIPQKDYPEIEEIKTLFKEMMELERTSGQYLEKNILACKNGDAQARKANENFYIRDYRAAMEKNRKLMDVFSKALTHGTQAEAQKMAPNLNFVKNDMITVYYPVPDVMVISPLVVSGSARGGWFFEGSFPLVLKDQNGKVLAESFATAQGEWMTDYFVPFYGTVPFPKQPTGSKGTLELKKDNPSGLPENDDSLSIPIIFGNLP